jgi:branched-chain amino acid transport system permease protein
MTPAQERPGTARAAWLETLGALGVIVGLALLLQFVIGSRIGNYNERVLLNVGSAIIMAVSLNIVNGYTGQFSIGHAGFFAVGGYVAGGLTYYLSFWLWGSAAKHGGFMGPGEWMMLAACVLGGAAAAGLGWLVGLPSLRLRGDYLAIVTLGFGEIVRVLLQQTNNQLFELDEMRTATWKQLVPPPLGGAQGLADIPKYTNLFWMYLLAGITVLFAFRLKQSSIGRALLAIREDEVAAQAMGVNVTRLKVRAFVFAAFFAGIAGGLYAHQFGTLLRPYDAGFLRSFDVVIAVVLGGMGSISGAVLAAIILTILPQLLLDLAQYRMILYALLLILLMIFRPQGLFGLRELWDYFSPRRRARRALA